MKQYNVRYQLKSDTEANWNKAGPKDGSTGFIPLSGEPIIYSADNAHPFSRLKIGDGVTNVVNLPFIDSGTLNGNDVEIVKYAIKTQFPATGSEDKLYIDISQNKLYHYTTQTGYTELLNINISTTTTNASVITQWTAGYSSEARISGHKLTFTNGTVPHLVYSTNQVIKTITSGGE